jgi:predicted amidophosphoribosyltransferase
MSLARFVGEVLQLVWPARCAGCAAIVPDAATFCDGCAAGLSPLVGACGGCALPQGAPVVGDHRCRTCRRVPFPFASGQAVF